MKQRLSSSVCYRSKDTWLFSWLKIVTDRGWCALSTICGSDMICNHGYCCYSLRCEGLGFKLGKRAGSQRASSIIPSKSDCSRKSIRCKICTKSSMQIHPLRRPSGNKATAESFIVKELRTSLLSVWPLPSPRMVLHVAQFCFVINHYGFYCPNETTVYLQLDGKPPNLATPPSVIRGILLFWMGGETSSST